MLVGLSVDHYLQLERGGLQHVLDAITDTPAWIRNAHPDMLTADRLGRAVRASV